MNQQLVFALSLCRKAGVLVMGFEPVKEAVMCGRARLVLTMTDAAERTVRHAKELCEGLCDYCEAGLGKNDLIKITKKTTAVLAVTDRELAKLCMKAIRQQSKAEKEERI